MDFTVDRCRRRPDCARRLIYLDTSTFAGIARGDDGAEVLAAVLRQGIDEERAICAGSPWHDDEISLLRVGPKLDRVSQTIRRYTPGLRMRLDEELIDQELYAAAREFSGEVVTPTWEEAFRDNPDEPPLLPFQAEFLNRRESEHAPAFLDEVSHERNTSAALIEAHTELRDAKLSWRTVPAANLDEQVKYFLGPLANPDFLAVAERRQGELVGSWLEGGGDIGARSPTRRCLRFAHITSMAKHIRERFPAVATDPLGFSQSDAVRHLPTTRLFAFLLAALSVDGRRTKPQLSDFPSRLADLVVR
jgi:hypothetical protein